MENLAQSTNELEFVNAGFTMDQKLYIDFGKDDGTNGNITGKDTNGNFWNNAVKTAAGTEYSLVNSYNQPVDYKMHLTTGFCRTALKTVDYWNRIPNFWEILLLIRRLRIIFY